MRDVIPGVEIHPRLQQEARRQRLWDLKVHEVVFEKLQYFLLTYAEQ
jgi:hypothetical protein